ncbi:carbon catabolite repression protein cred [Glonium stellatum]|uniref:Carbon catabolite repression protein cred n=1 Tax=Glonium stellatum TaxID=574774 RepID=A0A8E2EWT1_9PEZI|nr:carbon catabolite repression protein cred [Glonium stellatum]
MVRTAGGVFGGGNSKPTLEIRPDSPFVVFYGLPSEAQPAELTGKLVLTCPESMVVRSIKVTLCGMRKVSWMTNTVTPQPIVSKRTFLKQELNLFPADGLKNKAHKINPGVHDWSFRFQIPSDADESVEGLVGNYIVYNLNATVDRGYISKHLSATRHIRVVRTLGQDSMESLPMEQINEDIWASKLAYKITVPQKNYIVGTAITADFVLVPLRKGVEIGVIKMEVVEHMVLSSDYAGRAISHSREQVVASMESEMPADSAHVVPDGVEEADQLFDESHRFQLTLELPKSLKQCRQTVDTSHMKIIHKLRLYVNLHNPEGHTSQLLVKNHLHLFISPNLPPGEDQTVLIDHNFLSSAAMRDETHQTAPPTYGLHQLDELYNGIDPSGFMTPGPRGSAGNSGVNTPFYSLSRSGSHEDIPSTLGAVAHEDGNGASASALHSRLSNLSMNINRTTRFAPTWGSSHHSSGGSTPHSADESHTASSSNSHSRHGSIRSYFGDQGTGADDYPHPEYDMEALIRTPSYNTAVRTPARTPISEDLPTYETATSRPTSPMQHPHSGNASPSPTRSLDTLTEETERNTQLNSWRASPARSGSTSSGEQR